MLNRTLGNAWPFISSAHQSPSIPHIIIDKTSLQCGPIRSIALVLALTNGSKLKYIISPLLILTNIQFGHRFNIAIWLWEEGLWESKPAGLGLGLNEFKPY
nr:hypothetical protein [Morchella crassipes]